MLTSRSILARFLASCTFLPPVPHRASTPAHKSRSPTRDSIERRMAGVQSTAAAGANESSTRRPLQMVEILPQGASLRAFGPDVKREHATSSPGFPPIRSRVLVPGSTLVPRQVQGCAPIPPGPSSQRRESAAVASVRMTESTVLPLCHDMIQYHALMIRAMAARRADIGSRVTCPPLPLPPPLPPTAAKDTARTRSATQNTNIKR